MQGSAASAVRPRLAYLFSRYPVISQTFVDNEMLGLEAAGWELIAGTLHPPHPGLRHPRLNGLRAPVLHAPPPAVRKHFRDHLRRAGRWPDALIADHVRRFGEAARPEDACMNALWFAEKLPALGVSHVHTHFANRATYAALFLKSLCGLSYSFTPQAQDFLVDLPDAALLTEMCQGAEFIVAPCRYALEKLGELCPAQRSKMICIYNGIDCAAYPAARPAPSPKKLRAVSVGRLIEFKGFHHLLNAMALARDRGTTVELDLMGDGPWRSQLEEQVRALALERQVVFHGAVTIEQMRACFRTADAFVLACIFDRKGASDMLPTVITEAMCAGLPVVSSRLAGIPEQVIDGETGVLTEPGDEAALAAALVQLAVEEQTAARMGAAGKGRATEVFSASLSLEALSHHFARAAPRRRSAGPARVAAFYDLSSSESIELLTTEFPVLARMDAQLWLAGRELPKRDLERLHPALRSAFWLPEAAALDMEWESRPDARESLKSLRAQLGVVDDEAFTRAARRAMWLAAQSRRLDEPRVWYAPGAAEALTVFLAGALNGLPVAAAADNAAQLPAALRQSLSLLADTSAGNPLHRRPAAETGRRESRGPFGLARTLRRLRRQRALKSWLGGVGSS